MVFPLGPYALTVRQPNMAKYGTTMFSSNSQNNLNFMSPKNPRLEFNKIIFESVKKNKPLSKRDPS
jgi:hypothetical protein